MSKLVRGVSFFMAMFVACACTAADEGSAEDDLTVLLEWFLVEVDKKETHDEFWADDLVYTSSDGTRFDKGAILAGFDGEDDSESVAVDYVAEDVDIRVFNDAAVVAFTLRGTPTDSSTAQYYLNTGTFLRRNDKWQAVAWQATKKAPQE